MEHRRYCGKIKERHRHYKVASFISSIMRQANERRSTTTFSMTKQQTQSYSVPYKYLYYSFYRCMLYFCERSLFNYLLQRQWEQ